MGGLIIFFPRNLNMNQFSLKVFYKVSFSPFNPIRLHLICFTSNLVFRSSFRALYSSVLYCHRFINLYLISLSDGFLHYRESVSNFVPGWFCFIEMPFQKRAIVVFVARVFQVVVVGSQLTYVCVSSHFARFQVICLCQVDRSG